MLCVIVSYNVFGKSTKKWTYSVTMGFLHVNGDMMLNMKLSSVDIDNMLMCFV